MLGRRSVAIGGLALALSACADSPEPPKAAAPAPTALTADGRIIVRGKGLAYAIRPPQGWSARSVRWNSSASRTLSQRVSITVSFCSPFT